MASRIRADAALSRWQSSDGSARASAFGKRHRNRCKRRVFRIDAPLVVWRTDRGQAVFRTEASNPDRSDARLVLKDGVAQYSD
jgi:hypothetical protein